MIFSAEVAPLAAINAPMRILAQCATTAGTWTALDWRTFRMAQLKLQNFA